MRRFIYLDTDTLNSYLAQMFDGLIKSQDTETQKSKSIGKQNKFSGGLAGQIAFKLFGKGIDATAQATYERLKSVANEDMVKDVQTKIMHDNAFDQFVEHLQDNELLGGAEIGNFIFMEDDFYIFDIAFYQKLFDKNGFVEALEDIQKTTAKKEAEQKLQEFPREQQRNKNMQKRINEIVNEATAQNHEEFESVKKLIDMLATIIPYPQILCISNYIVVLNEKYLRDDLSTAAFKYGGRINVVGYITNKITTQGNAPISAFAGIGNSINALMKIFFENADEMFIVHPVAIYYGN